MIIFGKKKRLLLRLQMKSENIKNLTENKFSVRVASEEFERYDNLSKLFPGVQSEYHLKLDNNQRKTDDSWFNEDGQAIFHF